MGKEYVFKRHNGKVTGSGLQDVMGGLADTRVPPQSCVSPLQLALG